MPSRWRPKQPRTFLEGVVRGCTLACLTAGPVMGVVGFLWRLPMTMVMGAVAFVVGAVILVLDSEVGDAE